MLLKEENLSFGPTFSKYYVVKQMNKHHFESFIGPIELSSLLFIKHLVSFKTLWCYERKQRIK